MKPTYETIKEMADFFKAMSEVKRIAIVWLLASQSEAKLCVIDIADKLGISQPAASQHIRVLKNIGLLIPRRESYKVYYHIDIDEYKKNHSNINALYEMALNKCCASDSDCCSDPIKKCFTEPS